MSDPAVGDGGRIDFDSPIVVGAGRVPVLSSSEPRQRKQRPVDMSSASSSSAADDDSSSSDDSIESSSSPSSSSSSDDDAPICTLSSSRAGHGGANATGRSSLSSPASGGSSSKENGGPAAVPVPAVHGKKKSNSNNGAKNKKTTLKTPTTSSSPAKKKKTTSSSSGKKRSLAQDDDNAPNSAKKKGGGSAAKKSGAKKATPTNNASSNANKQQKKKKTTPPPLPGSVVSMLEKLPQPPPDQKKKKPRRPRPRPTVVALPSDAVASDVVRVRVRLVPKAAGAGAGADKAVDEADAEERTFVATCPPELLPPGDGHRRYLSVLIPPRFAVKSSSCVKVVGGGGDDNDGDGGGDGGESSGDPPLKFSFQWSKAGGGGGGSSDEDGKNPATPASSKKVARAAATPRSPGGGSGTYMEMVHEAIATMKDRNGSSVPAIMKYMMVNFQKLQGKKNVKHNLMNAIKLGVKAERFVKVRNSYKLNQAWIKKEKAAMRAKMAEKKKRERAMLKKRMEQKQLAEREKKRRELEALKKRIEEERRMEEASMTEAQREERERAREREREEREKKKAEERRLREIKAEEARLERIRQERIRRRRFPMDDLALIREDLELGLPNPPEGVGACPTLPRAFDSLKSSIVEDLFYCYHFLHGDLNYCSLAKSDFKNPLMVGPKFTMKQLAYAVAEVDNGNARKAKCVPPLLAHLFNMLLRVLTDTERVADGAEGNMSDSDDGSTAEEEEEVDAIKQQNENDFTKLESCLTPASWSEALRHYMELMDRVSLEKFSKGYIHSMEGVADEYEGTSGYYGYLGRADGILHSTVRKLAAVDAWELTAEEVVLLLRVLCDDVLSTTSSVAKEVAKRGDNLYELLKAKKAAETHWRKTKFAFEGPKKPPKKKSKEEASNSSSTKEQSAVGTNTNADRADEGVTMTSDNAATGDGPSGAGVEEPTKEDGQNAPKIGAVNGETGQDASGGTKSEDDRKHVHVPTVTKKQYEDAARAADEAVERYEKGLQEMVSRTEPIGYDRSRNAVYFVRGDPGIILIKGSCTSGSSSINNIDARNNAEVHIEQGKSDSQTEWCAIENRSVFDLYRSSLDDRGERESALKEALDTIKARRSLYDDIKEINDAKAAKKYLEQLEARLQNAREAVRIEDASGRRSGRLQSINRLELNRIEEEVRVARLSTAEGHSRSPNYRELTGLEAVCNNDIALQKEVMTDLTKDEAKGYSHRPGHPPKHCPGLDASQHLASSIFRDGGVMSILAAEMIDLERWMEALAPWDREDMRRGTWISRLKNVGAEWRKVCVKTLGPQEDAGESTGLRAVAADVGTPCKSNIVAPNADAVNEDNIESRQADLQHVIDSLRQPLLDLEERIYQATGLEYVAKCVEEANDNVSCSSSNDDPETARQVAWKKIIFKLHTTPTSQSGKIREMLIKAIAVSRSAGLHNVVVALRGALKKYRTGAAGAAKSAALEVLQNHGGYEAPTGEEELDYEDDDESVTDIASLAQDDASVAEESPEVESLLTSNALALFASLGGYANSEREEWKEAVRTCKTMARFAALTQAFIQEGMGVLTYLQGKNQALIDAIEYWQMEADDEATKRTTRGGKKRPKKKPSSKDDSAENFDSAVEIWADWCPTEEVVWSKVGDRPWWPSHVCKLKLDKFQHELADLGRVVVAQVGSEHIYVVQREDIREYSNSSDEDLSNYSADVIEELTKSIEMVKRLRRGRGIVAAYHKVGTGNDADAEEEKKCS